MKLILGGLAADCSGCIGGICVTHNSAGLAIKNKPRAVSHITGPRYQPQPTNGQPAIPYARGSSPGRLNISNILADGAVSMRTFSPEERGAWNRFALDHPNGYPAGRFSMRGPTIPNRVTSKIWQQSWQAYRNKWRSATGTAAYRHTPNFMPYEFGQVTFRGVRQTANLIINWARKGGAGHLVEPLPPLPPDLWLYIYVKFTKSPTSHCSNYGWRGPVPCGRIAAFPVDVAPFLPMGPAAIPSAGKILLVVGIADLVGGALYESQIFDASPG